MHNTRTMLVVIAAACLLLGQQAAAHSVMIKPLSRPWLSYLKQYNYESHAVAAGGVAKTSNNGKLRWPAANRNGLCGDAVGENRWDKPGGVVATYKKNGVVDVDVVFAQNHLGRMRVRMCPLNAKKESECKELQRTDGKGTAWDLPWVQNWHGAVAGFAKPIEQDGYYKTYLMPPVGKKEGCVAWSCDMFKGMYVYKTTWRLPKDFTCNHCKLQYYYLTGSRCWPPCIKGGACKKNTMTYPVCGAPGASYPEEFFGCADVKVA